MIRTIEESSMNTWPSLYVKLYDGWILRFSDGYTRRANSVNPIYDSTIPIEEKIDNCELEYKKQGLPTLFKITTQSKPQGIDRVLEKRGYAKINETYIETLDLIKYVQFQASDVVKENPNKKWLESFFCCSNINDQKIQTTAKQLINNILGEVVCVSKQIDGKIVGCGYGSIDRDYIGIFDVVVDKNFRGNGYGKDIVNGILMTAIQNNVKTAYLQVTANNAPAIKLYKKIGFKKAYEYWYRILE